MRYTRRSTLALLAGMAITPLAAVAQQDYPTRPITLVVPYGAGGTTDISARQMATMAEKILGQPIVVENQPGASGTNAMRSVASAKPDGYTLIATTSSPSFVTPALRDVGYDTLADFIPILNYSGPFHGVVVPADSPYDTLDALIEGAKSGAVTYGTAGAMGGAHLAFASVAKDTGTMLQHVPFDGASKATAAVLGGHVDAALVPAYRDLVQDGQLRLLGVLDGTSDPDFPDAPTLREAGLAAEFPSIVGIMAPEGTDPAIIAKLESAFTEVASSDGFKTFMTDLSQPVRIMSGEGLAATIEENLAAYREIAKDLGN
ncbi:tripartite-type tricarboxylate transporter receptor subunit TctC [Palleronia aestuarii]|uniref:Tripartite-type tricarboxylate transporter receptor subunit TctC n=1 Tax=Palleronia aestuarii TaxID=568105 RepID=A0A2W7MXS1_9RHOB|nr:tripartite tricarboxylate transporter substrate binding protein [Palleronia aestuarii]PZX10977.1 tripartite-type tricarboxylate transporter receptor subunit TctC [Palleronia aestuarii]